MTELILIRHGETDWNRELRFQGQVDVPLNAIGHEQARRVSERLAGEQVHHLYSSDLIRTRQTALPIADRLRGAFPLAPLATTDEAGLREQNFGVVDGMSVEEIKSRHPQAWERWTSFDENFAFTQGETTRDFHARVMAAVRRMVAAHPGGRLVLVTHGGVLDMIYRTARALSLSGPRQSDIPNGGISRVQALGDDMKILDWADVRHLADMPPQPVYDQSKLARPRAA